MNSDTNSKTDMDNLFVLAGSDEFGYPKARNPGGKPYFFGTRTREHGSDNTLPIFTWTLHRSHLNKGCYGMLHTPLKCNLVNFEIPNEFLYYGIPFGISKLTILHFKGVCNIP